jgi:DNA polymerase III beta subunit, central domain
MKATTNALILREAIEAVLPAMSKDTTRAGLNCVNLSFDSKVSRATACDGHWMAAHEIDCSVQEPGNAGIDPTFLKKLLVALEGMTGDVAIVSSRDKIQFAIEGIGSLATKAIGQCPPYDQVWPKGEPAPQPFMGLNAVLLAKVAEAFKRGQRTTPLKFEFYGELEPVVVTATSSRMKACVMPCRF